MYVANEKICESFVGFFELNEGVTGEAIAGTIEQAIIECNLDASILRGQAYDSASNISGKYKGCAAILKRNILWLYIPIVVQFSSSEYLWVNASSKSLCYSG